MGVNFHRYILSFYDRLELQLLLTTKDRGIVTGHFNIFSKVLSNLKISLLTVCRVLILHMGKMTDNDMNLL